MDYMLESEFGMDSMKEVFPTLAGEDLSNSLLLSCGSQDDGLIRDFVKEMKIDNHHIHTI